jgi:hypothetical protein
MEKLKAYLLSRTESTAAWIGFVGILMEIVLHMGNISVLMIVLFVLLIVLPEKTIKDWFAGWSSKVKS